jgi:hypothetical protein
MRRQELGGYPGVCRVHRAELKMLRGQWPEAELEARQACEELQRFGLNDSLGFAHHEIGEIRLRMGESGGAWYTPSSANFPAGTSWADVIVVFTSASDDKREHEVTTFGV